MPFPLERPRRLRRTEALRSLVRETVLSPGDLMWPLFVVPGEKVRNPVKSMPGVFQLSVDEIVAEAQSGWEAGVRSLILFGVPSAKDAAGTGAYDEQGEVASTPYLLDFARRHGLKIATIKDLIAHRRRTEKLVVLEARAPMPTAYGEFTVYAYRSLVDNKIGRAHV